MWTGFGEQFVIAGTWYSWSLVVEMVYQHLFTHVQPQVAHTHSDTHKHTYTHSNILDKHKNQGSLLCPDASEVSAAFVVGRWCVERSEY